MSKLPLLFLATLVAGQMLASPAFAIDKLPIDYRVIGQTGAEERDGVWTVETTPGGELELTVMIEPHPRSSNGTVMYPISQLDDEVGVPNAHALALFTTTPEVELDKWLLPVSFSYDDGEGNRAICLYNGEPVNAGNLEDKPVVVMKVFLFVREDAPAGVYDLSARFTRIYDDARRINEEGKPIVGDDELLHWQVVVEDSTSFELIGDLGRMSLLTPLDGAVMSLAVTAPMQSFANGEGQTQFLAGKSFTIIPLYADITDPTDFWGLMYIFGEVENGTAYLQLNRPDQGYPVTRMITPMVLQLSPDYSTGSLMYQVTCTPLSL